MPKIKNIAIFVGIGAGLFLVYFFFIRSSSPEQGNLVQSGGANTASPDATSPLPITGTSPNAAGDFLALLLNVNNIKIDDSIFSDPAFASLHDSTVVISSNSTAGRPNPFAQFGNDAAPAKPATLPSGSTTTTTPPVTPPATP